MGESDKASHEGKHPKALPILFFAEMWERFCFYGMRTLLTLYMVRGFLQYSDDQAFAVYGSYNSMVYLTPVLGGLLADRLLGYRRSIVLGGILMALGLFALLIQNSFFFFGGLALIIVGNGYFKPNISTLLGKLYAAGDPKRDAGFGIFYMGINIGAVTSTLICGAIGEYVSWTLGFGIAAAGMLAGLAVFHGGRKRLEGRGEIPDEARYKKWAIPVLVASVAIVPVITLLLQQSTIVSYILIVATVSMLGYILVASFYEEKVQRHRMWVILVLWFFHAVFWSFFEQAGSSLTLFAARNVDRDFGFFEFPAAACQAFNPLLIVAMTPFFAWLWIFLSKKKVNPSIPNKFALGLVQAGVGFFMLVMASWFALEGMTSMFFLVACYFFLTTGELFLSPVGLSMVTKLAPERMTGLVMGAWFLSIAAAHKIAAGIATLTGGAGGGSSGEGIAATESLVIYTGVFTNVTYFALAAGVLLFLISPILKKWLHGVE